MEEYKLEILIQGIKTKQSAIDDLSKIVYTSKSTQKYQEIYRLIDQLAVMAASSKTEMTPIGHMFPYHDLCKFGQNSSSGSETVECRQEKTCTSTRFATKVI